MRRQAAQHSGGATTKRQIGNHAWHAEGHLAAAGPTWYGFLKGGRRPMQGVLAILAPVPSKSKIWVGVGQRRWGSFNRKTLALAVGGRQLR